MRSPVLSCAILMLAFSVSCSVYADSASWSMNPTNGNWNRAANWIPATVPNGPTDVATFATSSITDLTFSAETIEVAAIVFNSGATSFNITADPQPVSTDVTLTISGTGITNNSGMAQNLTVAPSVAGRTGFIEFVNAASAGEGTVFTVFGSETSGAFGGGNINFHDTSTAGTASMFVEGALAGNEADGGEVRFDGNATAGNASVTIDGAPSLLGFAFGGKVTFSEFSSASDAVFFINPGTESNGGAGTLGFADNASAGNGIFTLNATMTSGAEPANVILSENSTASNGFFTVNGGQQADTAGGAVTFQGFSSTGEIVSAGTATFINNGGNGANSSGGSTSFVSFGGGNSIVATASQARLVANGGQNGGGGGTISFGSNTDGGEARIEVYGNGLLDVSLSPAITIGSIEGDGSVKLGHTQFIIGNNDLNTTFSGRIQGAGSFEKIGNGTLTLGNKNSYRGGTAVTAGTLVVTNRSASGTGSGPVSVMAGTLGGSGIIAGATTIGAGSGTGAFLAPAVGATMQATLTIQSALTFNADATYTCSFKAKQNRARTDQVIANGVTINSGAMIALNGQTMGVLPHGMVLTLISNTSVNPISGTFSNLPDGSIVTINGNNFVVSYSGGDGNDLTLTVVM